MNINEALKQYSKTREDVLLDRVFSFFDLPQDRLALIKTYPEEAVELTFDRMIERGMIPDAPTFHNVIRQKLKLIEHASTLS